MGSHELNNHTHFWPHPPKKIIEASFRFPEFVPACRKSVYSICSFLIYSHFLSLMTKLAATIADNGHPKNFSSTFNCRKFVLPCKNKTISSICSEDMVDLKILEFVCLTVFWAISQEQEFSHVWDLCRNTNNNFNSHYRPNSVKINDQIFQ